MNNIRKYFRFYIIIICIVLLLIVFLGIEYFVKSQKQIQELVNFQKSELDKQKSELEKQKSEVERMTSKVDISKNNQNQLTANKTLVQNDKNISQADIIEQWTPNMVHIACVFVPTDEQIKGLNDNGIDSATQVSLGSGLLRAINTDQFGNDVVAVITNRHVVQGYNGFVAAKSCTMLLPDGHKYTVEKNNIKIITKGLEDETRYYSNGQPYVSWPVDASYLIINNPDDYTVKLAHKPNICKTDPRIGDSVITIGYPSIGSSGGITATEGIVSGIEGDYFVTSAKVDHGNSGGAAIFKDKNCYFGIPSFVVGGELESLARILGFRNIFR